MKINLNKMRHFWWEDAEGNVLDIDSKRVPTAEEKEK